MSKKHAVEGTHDNNFYQLIFENVRDPILVIRPDGQIIDGNYAIVAATGYSKEELLSMNIADLHPPAEKARVADLLEIGRLGGVFVTSYLRKDGSVFPVEINSRDVMLEGKPAFLGIVRDITERKQAEEALRESEEKFKALAESSTAAIFVYQGERYVSVNQAAADMTGYTKDELLKRNIIDIIHPDFKEIVRKRAHDRQRSKPATPQYEVKIVAKNGEEKWVLLSASRIEYRGKPAGVATFTDITERKRTEEALRESEKKFKAIFNRAAMGLAISDQAGRIIDCNSAYEEMLGYSKEELQKKRFLDITHQDDAGKNGDLQRQMNEGLVDSYQIDKRYIRKDGQIIWCNLISSAIRSSDGTLKYNMAVVDNITERKRAEESLKLTQFAIDHFGDSAIWFSLDGSIAYVNEEACRSLGYSKEELLARRIWDIDPDADYSQVKLIWDEMKQSSGIKKFERKHRTRDGRVFPVEVTVCYVRYGDKEYIISFDRDITERKWAEEALKVAKAQAELYLDLMGHDINNMNQAAIGFLELTLMTLESERKLGLEDKNLIERPLKSLQTSSKLIENVRKIKKLTSEGITVEPVDLSRVLKELDIHSFNANGRDITINIPEIPHYMVWANELIRDALTNLITNAVKHSREDKPPVIDVNVEPATIKGVPHYKCTVEDNGPGIPDEVKGKLFHRFQRGSTKAHGKGLGLYLVRTLIEGYRGKVWVENRVPGDYTKGAKFVIMLPAAEK